MGEVLAFDICRRRRLRPAERVELPMLVDIDAALADLESEQSAARMTLTRCALGSLERCFVATRLTAIQSEIAECRRLREIVIRRGRLSVVR